MERRRKLEKIGSLLESVSLGIFVAIMALLMALCAFVTTLFSDMVNESFVFRTWLCLQYLDQMLLGLVMAGVITLVLWFVRNVSERLDERVVTLASLIVMIIISCYFVFNTPHARQGFPDSSSLIAYASQHVQGDYQAFQPDAPSLQVDVPRAYSYFSLYPFQAGAFYYFVVIFRIFGAGNILAVEGMNIVANMLAFIGLVGASRMMLKTKCARLLLVVLLGLCLPFSLSTTFPYGNLMGFGLICLFLWAQVAALKSKSWIKIASLQLMSLVVLTFSLIIKPTFKLVALGVCLCWFVVALKRARFRGLVCVLVTTLVASGLSGLPTSLLERRYNVSFGPGLPTVSWIEIGLTEAEGTTCRPGMWDANAIQQFVSFDRDTRLVGEAASRSVMSQLSHFVDHPSYALWFFATKLSEEWAEPSFQSVMYTHIHYDADGNLTNTALLESVPVVAYMDGYQLVVMAGAFIGSMEIFRRRKAGESDPFLLLAYCVGIGFACYVLWEAKPVYLMPFFVLLLPVASYGLDLWLPSPWKRVARAKHLRTAATMTEDDKE